MLAASGFGCDSERVVVTAPDEVWEEYLRSHSRSERLQGKRIEKMDDLAVIVGSDQAKGCYVQGSRSMAASSSRVQRDLNKAWMDGDYDVDDTVDLSEDTFGDSTGNTPFSSDTPSWENRVFRSTSNRTSYSDSNRNRSSTKK
ncbi:uncharacterized protein LOC131226877 [Magnolia sinica]|uniref:uncharacterized protein LOC131226877 n=1 Tax=Magnolia sinica TaxID=86752 RepID=UPI00265A2776|nr:uncharacterized protein LOC131226877 [Magnolia sinica]